MEAVEDDPPGKELIDQINFQERARNKNCT